MFNSPFQGCFQAIRDNKFQNDIATVKSLMWRWGKKCRKSLYFFLLKCTSVNIGVLINSGFTLPMDDLARSDCITLFFLTSRFLCGTHRLRNPLWNKKNVYEKLEISLIHLWRYEKWVRTEKFNCASRTSGPWQTQFPAYQNPFDFFLF